ncbi:MAG: nuclear transport factor 2 family protein [Acidimicrobiales bacterium]
MDVSASTEAETLRDVLEAFADAWRAGDIDRLMTFMTGDCEFRASVGSEPGTTFEGQSDVREGFKLSLAHDEGADVRIETVLVVNDTTVVQWAYIYPGVDSEVRGCDVFTFNGQRIRVKDSYRKAQADITRHALKQDGVR